MTEQSPLHIDSKNIVLPEDTIPRMFFQRLGKLCYRANHYQQGIIVDDPKLRLMKRAILDAYLSLTELGYGSEAKTIINSHREKLTVIYTNH